MSSDVDDPSASARPADGRSRPDPELPQPAGQTTPVPAVQDGDEPARQTAATLRSVSRLEEAN